jgi:hypothetical protein
MELILTILDELAPRSFLRASTRSFANNQAESKGIHLPAHAWVLYLTEHRLDQMNPTRM